MTAITTHVLDTSRGRPAAGVPVMLERAVGDGWEVVGRATTGPDGRAGDLVAHQQGRYRLRFDTSAYLGETGLYPEVSVTFVVAEGEQHYHLPLLLSPFGYSTYRGS